MIGAGCTTTPLTPPPRQIPIEAMQECPKLLQVTSGDPIEALTISIGNMEIFAMCEGWRQTLIKWIEEGY